MNRTQSHHLSLLKLDQVTFSTIKFLILFTNFYQKHKKMSILLGHIGKILDFKDPIQGLILGVLV